jgi:hypothetical protein
MDAKRFLIGTVVGAVVLFFVGYLLFNTILGGFYAANAGSATGVTRTPLLLWSIAIGCVGLAALLCYCMGNRAAASLAGGAQVGAIVGLLAAVFMDFVVYGTQNVANLTLTLVDPIAEAVHSGIGGAVIGLVLSKIKPG